MSWVNVFCYGNSDEIIRYILCSGITFNILYKSLLHIFVSRSLCIRLRRCLWKHFLKVILMSSPTQVPRTEYCCKHRPFSSVSYALPYRSGKLVLVWSTCCIKKFLFKITPWYLLLNTGISTPNYGGMSLNLLLIFLNDMTKAFTALAWIFHLSK